MILFIKHIDIEGPELLGDFFKTKGVPFKVIDLSQGDVLPGSVLDYKAIVSLGGPMNVYEEDKYSFLEEENVFIQNVLKKEIPFLGICLGSQLLAKACQAKIMKSPVSEIGCFSVSLTKEGAADPLFEGLGEEFHVFQWHQDTFSLPQEALLLVSAEGCLHQAFKVGPCAYGLQFHIEITEKNVEAWANAYWNQNAASFESTKERLRNDFLKKKDRMQQTAFRIFENFFKLASFY